MLTDLFATSTGVTVSPKYVLSRIDHKFHRLKWAIGIIN